MYANTKEREDMYENVLHQWLTKTSLDIFTVDSSGSTKFSTPSPQFSKWKGALSFDQGPKLNKCYSKLEMEAIKKAEEFFDFSNYSLMYSKELIHFLIFIWMYLYYYQKNV